MLKNVQCAPSFTWTSFTKNNPFLNPLCPVINLHRFPHKTWTVFCCWFFWWLAMIAEFPHHYYHKSDEASADRNEGSTMQFIPFQSTIFKFHNKLLQSDHHPHKSHLHPVTFQLMSQDILLKNLRSCKCFSFVLDIRLFFLNTTCNLCLKSRHSMFPHLPF